MGGSAWQWLGTLRSGGARPGHPGAGPALPRVPGPVGGFGAGVGGEVIRAAEAKRAGTTGCGSAVGGPSPGPSKSARGGTALSATASDRALPGAPADRFRGRLGLRVLELVEPAGEYAGRLLADLGCLVTKVEPPGAGCASRRLPPLVRGGREPSMEGLGLGHLAWNARKRSITLDPGTPEGVALLDRLLAGSDAVLLSAGSGPDAAAIAERHPGLVVGLLRGFPAEGPWAALPAEDLLLFAAGGLMYLSGEAGAEPVVAPGRQAFVVGGAQAAVAVAAALLARGRGAPGQVVEVCYQAALAAQENVVSDFVNNGRSTRRTGSQHRTAVPGRVFPCRDGFVHFMVAHSQPGSWQRFVAWLAAPELEDPRYADTLYRRAHAAEVDRVVEARFALRDREDLVTSAQREHIPCAPVYTVADLCRDPHLLGRGLLSEAVAAPAGAARGTPDGTAGGTPDGTAGGDIARHPGASAHGAPHGAESAGPSATRASAGSAPRGAPDGAAPLRIPFPAPGVRLPQTWPAELRAAPALGEHNRPVYCHELGLSGEELARLRARSVI
jgi:crotonobetainyl-CoA:carnitine CoA-transferase CaiB-like acyl-CoA transferase